MKIIAMLLWLACAQAFAGTLTVTLPDSCAKPAIAVTCGDAVQPPNPPVIPPPVVAPPGNACAGWNVRTIDIVWPIGQNSPRIYTDRYGSFGPSDMLVFRFRSPASDPSGGATLVMSEYSSYQPAFRTAAVSTTPCLMPPSPVLNSVMSQAPSFSFSVGAAFGRTTLAPNTTYYVSVVNRANGQVSCGTANCAMYVDFRN